ncbi:hypothetical protein [Bacillus sp. Au-Bac7]|nr:hypothetical protein [Bacillus sp. Au-Bac7]MCE4051687.1 hypothetical protein [Bacillus sp. Au-Bac7]
MVDQNTDRSGWGMLALVGLGLAGLIVKTAYPEVGDMLVDNIKALFLG